jgi:hypothetical protein
MNDAAFESGRETLAALQYRKLAIRSTCWAVGHAHAVAAWDLGAEHHTGYFPLFAQF